MIAEVIVDITASETDRVFDYLCDDDLAIGARVLAPFGPRMLNGFVIDYAVIKPTRRSFLV